MGLFKNIFGGTENKKEEKVLPWQSLKDKTQLDTISKQSFNKPQFIFKHSTTCGISRMVMNMFVSSYEFSEEQADLYYLDLLSNRDVSNETGYFFQLVHQSPQLLVIKDGALVANASHGGINDLDLSSYI